MKDRPTPWARRALAGIADLRSTWPQILLFALATRTVVPTLDDVLAACKGRIRVDIELKYYGHDEALAQRVVEIVERHGMAEEIIVMSLKYDRVAKMKAIRPDWTYGLLTTVQLGDLSAFDVDFLAVSAGGASRRFVRRVQNRGRDVYVWTVNDAMAISSVMGRGVDGVITDRPALAKRVREIRAGMNPLERLLFTIGTEIGVLSLPGSYLDGHDA